MAPHRRRAADTASVGLYLQATLLACLLFAAVTRAASSSQTDEDLIFEEEGIMRTRRDIEVAPVEAPLPEEQPSFLTRVRRQFSFLGFGSNAPTDDEDEIGSAGEEGSGGEQLRIYRAKVHVVKDWRSSLGNMNSPDFVALARDLERNLEVALRRISGDKTVKVSSMRRSDPGKILATVDINYMGWSDETEAMRRAIRSVLDSQYLGTIPVNSQFFSFEEPKAARPSCPAGQHRCPSGRCVKRCDGRAECLDGSDELNCVVEVDVVPTSGITSGSAARCETNELSCDDGTSCIQESKQCDGVEDCFDGTDEKNCPSVVPCGRNQYQCKTGECIDDFRHCDYMKDCPGGEDEEFCPCKPDEYECNSGQCVGGNKRCDGVPDCDDETDETVGCPGEWCPEGKYMCKNGDCIDIAYRCDGLTQCQDQSDEIDCPCRPTEWTCRDGSCIPGDAHCNGYPDCRDGSDEEDCPRGCNSEEWTCRDGSCVALNQRCDGEPQCLDRSDEENCPPNVVCGPGEWRCRDGACIPLDNRCDRTPHCIDRSDEENCPLIACRPGEWQCGDGTCIRENQRCNGQIDCRDYTDENECAPTCNPATLWQCNDGICIDRVFRCDGKQDCPNDNSDEYLCTSDCRHDQFRCEDNSCIELSQRCNGRAECLNGEDERGCPCSPDEFRCQRDGQCIDSRKQCDGRNDCSDGSDELNCRCPAGEWRCLNGQCIPSAYRCDGRQDCSDRSDETVECPPPPPRPPAQPCDVDQFECRNGRCISRAFLCDGIPDCTDGSDEINENCRNKSEIRCRSDQFSCSSGECVGLNKRCNGHFDCVDASDETGCPKVERECTGNEFRCTDGVCISSDWKCDNVPDCSDGSDETGCVTPCKQTEYQCGDGTCIPESERCDGIFDCADQSDERDNCCHSDEFQCRNGDCIPSSQRCNGYPECVDHSDEHECNYFICKDGGFIENFRRCDGRRDCNDGSDEDERCKSQTDTIDLKTYPDEQTIQQTREVVFQCRDEGTIRAPVRWTRDGNRPMPPGTTDVRGRLTIPNVQVEHSGRYYCEAQGVPLSTPGRTKPVNLQVIPYVRPTPPTLPPVCRTNEATCMNGQCIPRTSVCNGVFDCDDASDEMRCNPLGCEPNEYQCDNKRCVLKTWMCDSDDDCGDGSDERNCVTNPPGSPCLFNEFTCHIGNQCIPKSFHCDNEVDCQDDSDETGCSKPLIITPPPRNLMVQAGETFVINCTAIGVPQPTVIWRLNWGHVPDKCRMTSVDGVGVLTCPSAQPTDQGAYSCEALNSRGSVFATPDCIVQVKGGSSVCQIPYFNALAQSQQDCLKCFCFGATEECYSADRYITQLPPPTSSSFQLVGVNQDQFQGNYVIRNRQYPISTSFIRYPGGNDVQLLGDRSKIGGPRDLLIYFSLPDSHKGQQLSSYGGYLRYKIAFSSSGTLQQHSGPDVIMVGNNITLMHVHDGEFLPNVANQVDVRLTPGHWFKRVIGRGPVAQTQEPASREEIMMVLENIEFLLIRALYHDESFVDAKLSEVQLDTSVMSNSGQGQAIYVEECRCPEGYVGLSCQSCAPSYKRVREGPWLGRCVRDAECRPGEYGDPANGIPCQRCPCPLSSPTNQFSSSCYLDTDGQVTCNCLRGYTGRRCERCSEGYKGNPLTPGESCQPAGECNPAGSYSSSADPATGSCQCKEFVTGPKCDTCIQNSFYLNENNRYGCIDCFCMGITEQCTSSNWYRQQESVSFTNDRQGFELVDKFQQNVISNDIYVDSGRQELVFQEFSRLGQEVYYWKLPQRFLGDKVTSYGGNLTYSLRYVPTPGGQSSANAAAAVEIYGNDIVLKHYSRSQLSPSRQETVSVPLYEQYWERQDGQEANREHFLMALADLEYILIKATYTTNTGEVGLKEVILDYAEPRNTGQERAFAVEMCECPVGYQGLSCEDCAIGYTRSLSGLHLGTCIPCECNDHSEECDPEDGICTNCRDNTAGDFCDECALGFNRDASGRCIRIPGGECNCDVRGSVSTQCYGEHCQCKKNVQGEDCDSCKPGYFHLSSQNPDGCLECWCSGVSSQCFSSNYFRTQLPMQLLSDHGFMLANRLRSNVIKDGFNINVANNEISFSNFGALRDGETYYWSLPQMFTGNRLPSYGGNLTITQRYQAQSGGNQYADPDVIIRSSGGRELIWMNNRPLQPNILQTYVVPLFEENFTMNQQPASRADFLNALSSVEAVLVRATVSNRMTSTFLRDVIMDTAVSSQTGQPRAYAVEQCQCPKEYSGLSCEQCKPGYYRDTATNQCNQCPCNGREESCALRPDGRVRCDCLPGYHGDFCEESGLMLELRPMKVLFSHNFRERYANFTCSYHSSEPLRVVFTLEPALAKGETPFALMATNSPYNTERYTSGAKHYVTLRILRGHKTVTCRVYDASNMEVAQMVSQILYVSRARRERPPPGGDPSSATISVTVSEPSIVISAVGSTVQFHCSARTITDQRRVPVTWSKLDGVLPYARSSDNRQGLLEITQIQPSDSGVYICTASDGYIVFTQNATLRVQGETAQPGAPRVRIEEPREVVEVRRGQTLEVRCSAAGSPRPQVTWSYGPNRDRLPFNVFAQNGVLIFRSAQTDVSGEYYCTASNSQGTDYARIIINIVPDDRAPVPSPIPGGPLVVQVSREIVEVRSGETVRVSCTAAIPRSVTITWSRLAGPLPSQAVVANGELQIVNARPVDSGIYVCRITDDRTSRYEESSTRITVTEYVNLPSVSIQPDRQTINQGTNAELRCIATGTPAPIITWSKANEELGPRVTVDGSILRITDAVVSDRGMYVCSARNDGGTAQAASIVEVERREPPVIEIYPEVKQTIVVGASALFQCHLTAGIPPPSVRWTRTDGRPLKPNTEVLNGGVLRFNEVKGDEEGSYTCTAENDAGSVKAVAILEIQSLPFITIQPRPSPYRVRVGQRVRLECSAQGDPAPTVSWQKLQHNFPANIPSQSALPTVAVYEIASATRADEGTYQCSARNAAGTSEERLQLIIEEEDHIQPPPYYDNWPTQPAYPQRPEQESRYSVPRGGSFELRCAGGSDRESTQIDFKRTDDAPLPRGHRIQGGVLYLNNVDDSAAGEYVCIGSDRISGSILFTIYSYIQVLAPPRITLDPRRQVVRPGDHTRIHCSATGDQPITINWSKQGGYMPPSVIINGGEMMFRGISTSDAGQYICEAVNSAGSSEAVAEVVVNATDDGERLVITSVSLPQLKTENENQPEVNANEDKDGIFFYQLGDEDSIDASSAPSDGYFLSMPEEVVCHFVCHNATNCITATQLCDGIADCLDGSDEWNCLADGLLKRGDIFNTENKCLDFFKCGDGSCYPFYLNCDGHCDCNDCKDEKVCFRRRRQVTKEEPLLTAIQRDVLMYTGQTAELRCEVSGLTPSIVQWRRIGGSLPPGALPRGNLLRLPFIKVEDTGRYMCEARTPDGFLTSDVITLTVERSQAIPVRIEPSHRNVRIGEDIVLSCTVDGDPAAAVTWSRIGKYLPPNAQERGNQLWITNVQADNGGVYRCSVTTQNGVFDESYPLVIQDTISTENLNYTDVNTRSVKTRSVPYGTGVVMECYVSIPPPVSYTWSKQGGELPVRAHVQGATIDIPEVHTEDAGLYICTGSNNERSVDLLTLLVVTGVIPRFSGSSYITLPTLPRAYLTFDLDISFKPESDNGLILYNSQRAGSEDGDFVSFGMSGGHAEFRFDVGSGPAVIRSRAPLELNAWHTVRLSRNRKEGTMVVDDGVPVTGRSEGRFLGLDLVENMYLGSVPDFSKVQKQSGFNTGFRGCISRLVIGKTVTVDLMRDAKSKVDVGACETCAGNPCKNSGVCQEAYTETGHKCICPAGFSGGLCENTGEACYPGVCGTGRCVNKPGGFECFCPFGKVGERCERDITIVEPAFGDGAYIAYPTPKALRRFSVDMNFKPESLEDGVLMYCAQRESGEGDFTSLAIRNKRLEFRFNTGSGTALIQSDPLQQDQWVEVRANRTDRLGSMSINGGQMQNTESPGTNRGLNLVTPLFIGGVDNSRIEISPEVSVNQGFHGCVKEIKLMDQEMRLADSLVDSANVGQCGGSSASMCTLNSCNNRGQCIDNPALPHGYTCNCIDGYSGHNCEVEPGVCSIIQPCRNGGACIGSGDVYSCRCPLGFAGQHCEHDVQVLGSASFSGDSWVEFDRSMLPQEGGETQKITFEFSTVKSEGLLFWLGQEAGIPGRGQDYVSVAIVDGFVEFAYQLGTGPAFVRSRNRVNDGERHTLIVKRTGRQGSIELDGSVHEYGESPGMLHMLNTRGNIYIGGVPDLQLMTDGTHTVGFQGCIHQLTIGEEKIVNYMRLAVSGINVTRCPSSRDREGTHVSTRFDENFYSNGGRYHRRTVKTTKTVTTTRKHIHG